MFESILNIGASGSVDAGSFLICTVCALLLGLVIAASVRYKSGVSFGMGLSLSVLPVIVEVIIMLVNGNIGAGVAVAGAFSLVRFRSVPGSAVEITGIFLSMGVGLACGMGYVTVAAFLCLFVCAVTVLFNVYYTKKNTNLRTLKVAIPENVDYMNAFCEAFSEYTEESKLKQAKTTDMGSLFELKYIVRLKSSASEKEFIDAIRVKNSNLSVSLTACAVDDGL